MFVQFKEIVIYKILYQQVTPPQINRNLNHKYRGRTCDTNELTIDGNERS